MTVWIISWVSKIPGFPKNCIVHPYQYSSCRKKLTCLEALEFIMHSLKSLIYYKKPNADELKVTFCFIGGIVIIPILWNEKKKRKLNWSRSWSILNQNCKMNWHLLMPSLEPVPHQMRRKILKETWKATCMLLSVKKSWSLWLLKPNQTADTEILQSLLVVSHSLCYLSAFLQSVKCPFHKDKTKSKQFQELIQTQFA